MKKFYKTEVEFKELHARLKLMNCPHCNHIGFLILHGYLYGYPDNRNSHKIKRGHRIFCSNRNRKNGCGRTFSILITAFIKKFTISAKALWRYLEKIKDGKSKAKAFQDSGSNLAQTSIYRIYKRFTHNQGRIRTFLSRVKDPPQLRHTNNPVILTIMHLKIVFQKYACPISQFQHHFQASFIR